MHKNEANTQCYNWKLKKLRPYSPFYNNFSRSYRSWGCTGT